MDLNTIVSFTAVLMQGGPGAVMVLLLLVILALILDRRRLVAEIAHKNERIEKIADDYYKGNITMSEALLSLKMVLFELKGKL